MSVNTIVNKPEKQFSIFAKKSTKFKKKTYSIFNLKTDCKEKF